MAEVHWVCVVSTLPSRFVVDAGQWPSPLGAD